MTAFRAVRTATAASLLLLAAACANGGDAAAEDSRSAGYGPGDLVIRVEYVGGFMTPSQLAARLPLISVYGDGRVITEGPQILIYPGPALPNVQQQQIDPADVQALVDKARAAGIGGAKIDYGQPPIADAPSTRFVVEDDTAEVYALSEAVPGQGLTEQQQQARGKLRDLLAALTDLPATLGADSISKSVGYSPEAVAAVATAWRADRVSQEQTAPPAVAWPGPALPGDSFGPEMGCVTATGDQAKQVLAAAAKANTLTPWTSGGKQWLLTLRPLLPDESGCADLRQE